MFIAISKYTKPLEVVDRLRAAHKEYLQSLFAADKLLISGRQNPPAGGVIISKAISRDEFKEIIANDPFTKAEVAVYTITEFEPGFHDVVLNELIS
jgi:uncharacterized protein YciI